MFLLREFIKSFIFSKKKRIGFILPVLPTPYWGRIMASARLRVYDVINNFLGDKKYFVELYKPWKKYDVVIFQKKFDKKALIIAKKLKSKGVKIVLDINVNFYNSKALKERYVYMKDEIFRFTEISDAIIASTEYLNSYIKKIFPQKKVFHIPENITNNFFSVRKKIEKNNEEINLLYVGYSIKAEDVLIIKSVLEKIRKKYKIDLIFICDKNPKIKIKGIRSNFIKYKQKKIHKQMLKGDIFISPRNLKNEYNLGHSFSKIGYPMSVGIPVVASKVYSYIGSPALLPQGDEDWQKSIEGLIADIKFRKKLSEDGIKYCYNNFSEIKIKEEYQKIFEKI